MVHQPRPARAAPPSCAAIDLLAVGRRSPIRPRALARLPAPALRRHAAAGDDRDGAGQQARACSSPTSRPPHSTSRPRPRSWSCSPTSGARSGSALLLVTHDLGVVAGLADRVVVMYAGRIVEEGTVDDVFTAPRHPYTRGLLAAIPARRIHGAARLVPVPGVPPNPSRAPAGLRLPSSLRDGDRCVPHRCPRTPGHPLTSQPPSHRSACIRARGARVTSGGGADALLERRRPGEGASQPATAASSTRSTA